MERDKRLRALEDEMQLSGLTEEEKEDRRKEHYKKESNYLRIKRQRLAYSDFDTLKIIGKGFYNYHSFSMGWPNEVGSNYCKRVLLINSWGYYWPSLGFLQFKEFELYWGAVFFL